MVKTSEQSLTPDKPRAQWSIEAGTHPVFQDILPFGAVVEAAISGKVRMRHPPSPKKRERLLQI